VINPCLAQMMNIIISSESHTQTDHAGKNEYERYNSISDLEKRVSRQSRYKIQKMHPVNFLNPR
jgi:hypothetical protein